MLRKLAAAAVLMALAAALAWAFWPRPVSVETASAETRELRVEVREEGKSRIREVYTVSAPISGEVLRIGLHAGDRVEKDKTVIASMKPAAPGLLDARVRGVAEAEVASAEASLGLARAEVKQAEAQLAFMQTELSRAERLAAQGTVSERAREKARLDADTAAAALDSARAALAVRERELGRARAALIESGSGGSSCCTDILAPVTGHILRVLAESEQAVQAGTRLMEIGDPGDLEIVTDVLSRDAVEISAGAEALIENWGGAPLRAKVKRVEPSAVTKVSALGIEEQRVTVVLDLADRQAAAGLGDGFRVEVRIVTWEGRDVLSVPVAALFRDGADWAVFTVADGRAQIQHVQLGQRNDALAQVTSGLAEGAAVILHPSDEISSGASVETAAAR